MLNYYNQSIQRSLHESGLIGVTTQNMCVVEVNLVLMEHRRAAWFILWALLHFCINGAHSYSLNIRGRNLLPMLLEWVSILLGVNGKIIIMVV